MPQDPTKDTSPITIDEIPPGTTSTDDPTPDPHRQLGVGGGKDPTADELAAGEKKIIDEIERLAREGEDIEKEPGTDEIPPETDLSAKDKEWLAELGLGLENDYDSVEDAIIGLTQKNYDLEQKMGGPERQVLDKLEKLSSAYKVDTDKLLDVLVNQLDPGSGSQLGAEFNKLSNFLRSSSGDPDEVEFYQNHARALTEDLTEVMKGMFARSHNMLYDMIQDFGFDLRSMKHLNNISDDGQRKLISSRMPEAKRVLKEILKDHYGKPNDIDIALRYLQAGESKPSYKRDVDREAGKKIKSDRARQRRFYTESAGRIPAGSLKLETEADMEKANPAAIRAKLKAADNM